MTITAPVTALTKKITFGTYVQGGTSAVEGTIRFAGTFTIGVAGGTAGEFNLSANTHAQFHHLTITTASRSVPFFVSGSEERISMVGTLTNNRQNYNETLGKLNVAKSFKLKGSPLHVDALTVHSGATLSLEATLYVYPRRGTSATDNKRGVVTIDGVIDGTHPIALASRNAASQRGGASDQFFHTHEEYTPADNGSIDYSDCIRITGTGVIRGQLQVLAYGNICYELAQLAGLELYGSIVESGARNAAKGQDRITADVIFRKDVVIGGPEGGYASHDWRFSKGSVFVWNDARVVFEKAATVEGRVVVNDGTEVEPRDSNWNNWFGTARTESVRKGVQIGGTGDYTCAYATGKPANHIPGVQFEGAVTIKGDMEVHASTLANGAPSSAKASAPACAPRVLFMAPVAKSTGATGISLMSSIEGDLSVGSTEDFSDKGRVHLDSDMLKTGAVTRRTAHNVQVGGNVSASGNTIGMASPTTSSPDGMCTGKDTELTFGNRIVLTGTKDQLVGGNNAGVMLDALVVLGDLEIQNGTLTVKTLHVGPRAELTANKNVKVTESLILEGELSGELDEASMIKRLTYGSGATDVVKKAALNTMLDALAIHVGSGEIRLDEVVKTKNLGLCSGTLSLADAESTTDSTLHVTEHITVQNGMLEKDTNDPGSISTDKAKTANVNDRYVLTYITPGKRTVTDALEWFDPRDVIVNHASAEITTSGNRSIVGKLTITKGKLMVDGMLTVGISTLDRTSAAKVDNYSVFVAAGELHTEGQDVRVHGKVTVKGKSKLMTEGGDLHVLGRVSQGKYIGNTAQVTVEKDAMIHLGDGTLMLGPEDTQKRSSVQGDSRPDVLLTLTGSLTADRIKVPKGSKQTTIDASADSKMLQTVVFDGTMTPGTGNWDGTLYLKSATADGKMLTVDSLSAMQGSVETSNKKVVIMDAVSLSSATIWPYAGNDRVHGGPHDQRDRRAEFPL